MNFELGHFLRTVNLCYDTESYVDGLRRPRYIISLEFRAEDGYLQDSIRVGEFDALAKDAAGEAIRFAKAIADNAFLPIFECSHQQAHYFRYAPHTIRKDAFSAAGKAADAREIAKRLAARRTADDARYSIGIEGVI